MRADRSRTVAIAAALLCALGLASAPARAGGPAWLQSPRLLGDPGGWRSALDDHGFSTIGYVNHYTGVLLRGAHGDGHSGTVDLFGIADLEQAVGWPGGTILVHAKSAFDENVNGQAGTLNDPFDDADFDEPIYIAQLWLEQALWAERVRFRLGYLDSQVTYDRNAYANSEDRQFFSTFLDNNGLLPLKVGFGAALILRPWEPVEIVVGTADADNSPPKAGYDTAFDGVRSMMFYAEGTLHWELGRRQPAMPGTLHVGVVRDATRRTRFRRPVPGEPPPDPDRGHWIFYVSADQMLYRESADPEQGLGWFGRYGHADEDRNRVADFWSTGFEYRGVLPTRDRDVLGVGVYQTIPSDRYRDEIDSGFGEETGIEAYYQIQLWPWLTFTPDVQWVNDPGGSSQGRDVWVLGFRFRVSL
jgi:porin